MAKYGRTILGLMSALVFVLLMVMSLLGNQDVRAQVENTPTLEAFPTLVPAVLLADIDRTEAQVQNIRQLTPRAEINREILPEDDLRHLASRRLASEFSPEEVQNNLLFYSAFGFIDGNADLYGITDSLVVNQVADFYDPQANIMYMVEGSSLDPFRSVLYARQYALVLQDQHYDTQAMMEDTISHQDNDRAMALFAFFEGDAHLTTLLFTEALIEESPDIGLTLIGQSMVTRNPVLDEQASIFKAELLLPSEAGLNFVRTLYDEAGGWRLVNDAYDRPPLSTEQILHPNLYFLYEEPHDVSIEPLDDFWAEQLLDEQWTLIHDQTLGEFYLREHLRLFLDRSVADETAAGWGGDRFLLYHNEIDNETVVIWKTSWDSPEDALEFDLRYGDFMGKWYGVVGEMTEDSGACWTAPGRSACKIVLSNNEVFVVFAPTAELATTILEYEVADSRIRILG